MRTFVKLAVAAIGLVSASAASADVTISAAISLKGALEKAKPALEKAAGEPVQFNFGASGTLAAQIRQGAPVDLFISADRANVAKLIETKDAVADSVKVVASNELVLVTPLKPREGVEILTISDLARPQVKRVAMGDPKTVPAGAYARDALTALKLYEPLDKDGKIVTGENVARVLTYVARGEVDAGFIYRTDALPSKDAKIMAAVPSNLHAPIEYVSAIPSKSAKPAAAAAMQKVLLSESGQKVFAELGFKAPAAPAASEPATKPAPPPTH